MSPHLPKLVAAEQRLRALGQPSDRLWALQVAPIGCERVAELLFDRKNRPDVIFATDDNLVEPLLAGLRRAKMEPGKDVYVLAHCNWPQAARHVGGRGASRIRRQGGALRGQGLHRCPARGRVVSDALVPARFLEELTRPLPTS